MTGEREPGRRRGALAWAGAGLLVGALVWAGVVAWAYDGERRPEETGGWWLLSLLIALLVLARGVAWRRGGPAAETGRYVSWMCAAAGLGLLAALFAFPRDAFEATTRDPWAFTPAPFAVHLWLVACAVGTGCVLMLLGRRGPDPRPLRRSLPFLGAGALAVPLAGVLVARFLVPWVPHHVADGLGEPAPVPAEVSEAGWEWRTPMGTEVDTVRPGSHGPLVLLYDGAVALDGGTGEELWSYRRPHDRVEKVWVADGRVHVRHGAGTDDSGEQVWETVVLDAGTGEVLEEGSEAAVPSTGWMNEHGRALVEDLLELPDHCVVAHTQSYGHRLVGVVGCLEVADEETVEQSVRSADPFGWEDFRTEVAVVAVDPLEGTELWRTGWTAPPSAPSPRLGKAPGGTAGSAVIVQHGPEGRTAVLDPGTGEELVAPPEELASSEDLIGVAYADADRAVFAVETGHLETTFHRVDAAGETTGTAVVEEAYLGYTVGSERIALLDGALVIARSTDVEDVSKTVMVAPFGETTRWRDGVLLELEREGDLDVLAVPGAAVLVGQDDRSQLLEGLVP
ncbi:hypothetical protein [Nocardiopsis ganjiahuensis]|uniref:hypothetical protein n=1 Tax=Nocardiopsis ganjiahuensis TaxID=239984 RepID=UPI001EF9DD89|nr:hypothetical protein [Nocardiopsis ganjiahuensis]